MKTTLTIDGKLFNVELGELIDGHLQTVVNGKVFDVQLDGQRMPPRTTMTSPQRQPIVSTPQPPPPAPVSQTDGGQQAGNVVAPIPGLVLNIHVTVGETVTAGQHVATIEAMKMENPLVAPVSGIVREILVQKGSEIYTGQIMMRIG